MIKANNANELFIKIAKELKKKGQISFPRCKKTIELQNAWFTLKNPIENVVSLKSRNINYDYLKKEMDWYLSGDLRIDKIKKASKFWIKLADSNNTVNSNYGYLALIQKWSGKSQYEWCIKSLNDDPHSRQALINYNQPVHKYVGNKDFVCTIAQLFRINKTKLDSTVMMRSNDLIRGLTYDLVWFTYLQKKMADELGLTIGKYHHFAASLHVYSEHFEMLDKIAKEKL